MGEIFLGIFFIYGFVTVFGGALFHEEATVGQIVFWPISIVSWFIRVACPWIWKGLKEAFFGS